MSIYFYKLTSDNGGAPCVQDRLLSLAICKPMIRTTAKLGDVIFGFAATSLHADNRLLYIARVTAKEEHGSYYAKPRFAQRGDCIYERRGNVFAWRVGSRHHGPVDLVHDLGSPPDYPRASVLLSDDFRYFGAAGSAEYKSRYPAVKYAVEHLGRGHRVHHDEPLRLELQGLMRELWSRASGPVIGTSSTKPRRSACHRGSGCGIVSGEVSGR